MQTGCGEEGGDGASSFFCLYFISVRGGGPSANMSLKGGDPLASFGACARPFLQQPGTDSKEDILRLLIIYFHDHRLIIPFGVFEKGVCVLLGCPAAIYRRVGLSPARPLRRVQIFYLHVIKQL